MPRSDGPAPRRPPRVHTVEVPTLHEDQVRAYRDRNRFRAIRCGRRWGKTHYGVSIAADAVLRGERIGWFAPEYKFLAEPYAELLGLLGPTSTSASENRGIIRTITGGAIDFWSLDNPLAGRGRRYHLAVIDEAAFAKDVMLDVWRKNIRPTLVDYRGRALVLSNTNGEDTENFFWQICTQAKHGFTEYHAPSQNNPFLPAEELADLKANSHPLVYAQEYLADFVDFSGEAFFALGTLLVDNLPVAVPEYCDSVFAVIDTAIKTGREHDGTAVIYCAVRSLNDQPLIILDWDIVQVEGALLETWLPTVFSHLEHLAGVTKARHGSLGAWIEDKSSGTILLQQASRRGWQAHSIDSKLTSLGKDERAISVSGYVYRGMVKLSEPAFNRVKQYKETTRTISCRK